jgi:hypothetical protein
VRKYADFANAFKDLEYLEKISEDEERFVELKSVRVLVGWEVVGFDCLGGSDWEVLGGSSDE